MDNSVKIYFAPRFHINLYHSYRGDTYDENGFGKDIRIIRNILDDIDRLEKEGIVIHCAWDADNAFSLGEMLPSHAPDIISRIKERVERHIDEIHIMSWNNGLLGTMEEEEFQLSVGWAIESPFKDGVKDVFNKFVPIVRPQECMFTPNHIPLYKKLGIEILSIYYSAIPFNGFGSFIPTLSVNQQYNPITLEHPITKDSMRILPACNQGDFAEYGLSLRRMVKSIRRKQIKEVKKRDLLILLDMDADDSFWDSSSSSQLMKKMVPSFSGLYTLVKSIVNLPFVSFISPYEYAKSHEDLTSISLGQDLADGAFDGYASWAEKWENFMLWPKILQSRSLMNTAKQLFLSQGLFEETKDMWWMSLPFELSELAQDALRLRLRALSTTHFGLSAPVMNVHRLKKGIDSANNSIECIERLIQKERELGYSESILKRPYGIFAQESIQELEILKDGKILLPKVSINPLWIDFKGRKRGSASVDIKKQGQHIDIVAKDILSDTKKAVVEWERHVHFYQINGNKSVGIDMKIHYPVTNHIAKNGIKTERLGRTWDKRWRQIAPCEIEVFRDLPSDKAIRVWKEDFNGNLSSYSLDYIFYSKNRALSSINNHLTPHWVALSDGDVGFLLVFRSPELASFASCPLRQSISKGKQQITMNPFGTYWGPQYHYPSRVTGLGRLGAVLSAEHLHPSAPSWEGKDVECSLLLIQYKGDSPPRDVIGTSSLFFEGKRICISSHV